MKNKMNIVFKSRLDDKLQQDMQQIATFIHSSNTCLISYVDLYWG
jgi:hypothetical protein